MIRAVFLATTLLFSPAMAAEILPVKCTVVELDWRRMQPPPPYGHEHITALLDMQGRWKVSSWADIVWAAANAPDDTLRCFAANLVARRKSITETDNPDLTCPSNIDSGNPWSSWDPMQRIMDADPVVRACRPPARCEPGDTCA